MLIEMVQTDTCPIGKNAEYAQKLYEMLSSVPQEKQSEVILFPNEIQEKQSEIISYPNEIQEKQSEIISYPNEIQESIRVQGGRRTRKTRKTRRTRRTKKPRKKKYNNKKTRRQ
jgi:hypothetical protein